MDLLTLAYTLTGVISGIAYIPQIRTLWYDKTGAAAINLNAWALFTLCSVIGCLYAIVKVPDPFITFCSCIYLTGNCTVLALGCLRRFQMKPEPVRSGRGMLGE